MTSEDPHAITSAPASRRSYSATFGWLIATAERCRRWPGIGLAMLFVYKHVAAFARRVLSARPP